MLIVKRIFPNSIRLTYCICTSAVNRCEKPPENVSITDSLSEQDQEWKEKRKKSTYVEKIVSPEEKERAKTILRTLSESMSVENYQKDEDPKINLRDLLQVQITKKQARKERKTDFVSLISDAAEAVAEDLGGDKKIIKKDLLSHLRTIEVTEEKDVQEKFDDNVTGYLNDKPRMNTESTLGMLKEVFSQKRLNIFGKIHRAKSDATVKLNIWEELEKEELAYLATKPPSNQLEEWIMWTEQGKLWHFPIDNDQGMEKEAEVDFTEHVFLEQHLEGWCPKKGPLKKFMDLVLVGLSKNPYLTVEDKKEHIFWYRDYFEKKKKLLQELGALGSAKEIGESSNPS